MLTAPESAAGKAGVEPSPLAGQSPRTSQASKEERPQTSHKSQRKALASLKDKDEALLIVTDATHKGDHDQSTGVGDNQLGLKYHAERSGIFTSGEGRGQSCAFRIWTWPWGGAWKTAQMT